MQAAAIAFKDTFAHNNLRQRVQATINLFRLFAAIDADPQLTGAGVAYVDSALTAISLREFSPVCRRDPVVVVLREPARPMSLAAHAADLERNPRESRAIAESLGAGLSCGAAALSWLVIIGSAGVAPLSGGMSTGLTVLTYSAAIASTAQCFNSSARTYNGLTKPQRNDAWDSNEWYSVTADALDYISLAGATAAGFATIRMVKTLRAQGISVQETLRGLDRAQRARLTREIIRVRHPLASGRMVKFMQRSGQYPRRYAATEISRATAVQLKNALGAGLSFAGSAIGGNVSSIAVGVFEVMSDE